MTRRPLLGRQLADHRHRLACARAAPRSRWGALAGVLAALALAGCGTPWADVNRAVGEAGHAAGAVTRLSQNAVRSWCPQAGVNGGRDLTQTQARACLQRAWQGWLGELRRNGYNPSQVGR